MPVIPARIPEADPSIINPIERRARLAVATMHAVAQRVAAGMTGPAADAHALTPQQLHETWQFTDAPDGDGAATYWQVHDATLAKNLATIPTPNEQDPQAQQQYQQAVVAAHGDAERTALEASYPGRLALYQNTPGTPEQVVAKMQHYDTQVRGREAKGSPAVAPKYDPTLALAVNPQPVPTTPPPDTAPPPIPEHAPEQTGAS